MSISPAPTGAAGASNSTTRFSTRSRSRPRPPSSSSSWSSDYPHEKKLPDELKAQNAKLAKKYNIHGYPSILLIDAEGEQVAAIVGYRAGGPEKYMETLAKLLKLHDSVVEMLAALPKADGLDRAKLLDRLIDATTELGSGADKQEGWTKEIVALDPDNKAGLKIKYEFRQSMAEVTRLMRAGKLAEAREEIAKAVALPGLSGEQKQDAYYTEAQLLQRTEGGPALIAAMKKALDAAPDGPKASQIKASIERLEATVEAEKAALKLKAQLENIEAERLKVLDETIQAYTKANYRVGGKDERQLVQEWMQEAIRLDPDNAAGMKAKYEYLSLYLEGQNLLQSGKAKEAVAVIEKALALPDITPDQTSRAVLLKCNCFMRQKDYQGLLACAKKAQDGAKGMSAAIFKYYVQQAERAMQRQKEGKEPDGAATMIAPMLPPWQRTRCLRQRSSRRRPTPTKVPRRTSPRRAIPTTCPAARSKTC